MKTTEARGIKVDEKLHEILEKAVKKEGRQTDLAKKLNIPDNTIKRWRGRGSSDSSEIISWEKWIKIRGYLIENGLISDDDIDYMSPDDMRVRLINLAILDKENVSECLDIEMIRSFRKITDDRKKDIIKITKLFIEE